MNSNLTACPACNKPLSKSAPACPHCGHRTGNANQLALILVAVVLVLVIGWQVLRIF